MMVRAAPYHKQAAACASAVAPSFTTSLPNQGNVHRVSPCTHTFPAQLQAVQTDTQTTTVTSAPPISSESHILQGHSVNPSVPVHTLDSQEQHETKAHTAPPATCPDPASLFDQSFLPKVSPSVLLYFPFGCVIALLRMSLWLMGILIDAPWFRNTTVIRTYLSLLGFKCTWKHLDRIPHTSHVMVSNHTTPGDLMALFTLPQRYIHLITTGMPARVTQTHNLPAVLKPASPETIEKLAAASQSNSPPIHLFPEGGLTNGKGMMQFSRGFTKLSEQGLPVVPVALKAKTAFGVRTHTLTSSFLANLFWMSFAPWIEVEAVVLPALRQEASEPKGFFAQRVQKTIAEELNVGVADLNIQKKRQMMKAAKLK